MKIFLIAPICDDHVVYVHGETRRRHECQNVIKAKQNSFLNARFIHLKQRESVVSLCWMKNVICKVFFCVVRFCRQIVFK